MKRKLQLLLTTLLLTIVGATGAWADGVTLELDVCFRTNAATQEKAVNTDWESGYPKKASTTNAEFECNAQAGLFVLQKYTVADLDKVNKLVLRNVNSSNGGGDAIAIWVVEKNTTYGETSNFSTAWTESTKVADIVAAYTETTGIAPRATKGTINTTYLVDGTSDKTDGNKFTINGDALTRLKNNAVDNTFTLLLTNKTGDMQEENHSRKFCSSGSETDPLKLIASYNVQLESNSTTTYHETLNAAFDAIAASGTGTITLYGDATITSRCNVGAKTITVVPSKAGISITSSLTSSLWLLNNTAGGNLTIGSDTYQLTIGGSSVVTNSSNFLETSTKACTTLLNNVKFKNLTTTNNGGVVNQKSSSSAVLTLKNCAFENCTAPTDRGVVFTGSDDALILCGNNTFTNCSTYDVYLEKRFKIDATNGVTNTTPIRIYAQESNIKLGNAVATQSLPADEARFFIMNKDYACYSESDGSSRANLTICEGKTLDVTAAEAATLVLPFEATIPEGVSCYRLSHTDGNAYATATPVETTLPAEYPVLIYASEGSYKFRNSSKATTATSIPGSPSTKYALTGVYSELAFTPENIESDYRDVYILNKHSTHGLGFYKAVDGKKVGANRCYLTATNVPDAPGARLSIVFDEEETTGIENLTPALSKGEGAYFDLSGRRVAQPTKGLYIVNGKKVVIK